MKRLYMRPATEVNDLYAKELMQLPADLSEPTFDNAKSSPLDVADYEGDDAPQRSIWDETNEE